MWIDVQRHHVHSRRWKSVPAEKSHALPSRHLWEPPALSSDLLEAPKEEEKANSHFQQLLPPDLSRD